MKTILLTGGSGFIGRNILPILREKYDVLAPTRQDLNLLDENAVAQFFNQNKIDYVVHTANASPAKNPLDKLERIMPDSLRAYYTLERCSHLYEKMFYLGSGAEYDKRQDIISIKEEDFGKKIPTDDYGFAKYIMNLCAKTSENIYNLRIFGCYGPTDAKTKFIRDAIDCCLQNRPITIRQNCMFDYIYVTDLGYVILNLLEKKLSYHDYNICTGKRISLLEIAKIVSQQMNNLRPIKIVKKGWNKEYTGDNTRLLQELGKFQFTPIEHGVLKQIKWQRNI